MRSLLVSALGLLCAIAPPAARAADESRRLETNRLWDVLTAPSSTQTARGQLLEAGQRLGEWELALAGIELDGPRLVQLAREGPDEHLEARVRDATGRPLDLGDLLLFLDDVLAAGTAGRRGETIHVTAGRARKHGILLHPDDVFGDGPRRYGEQGPLPIDVPEPQRDDLPAAQDGDPLGPNWTMRFRNPLDEEARLRALTAHTGDPDFERRVRRLVEQLRAQGAEVYVNSTVRSRERGYLMWGAFVLSRATSESSLLDRLGRLEAANRDWGLNVPIRWRAQGDWTRTREAAREMADTYQVVYATERGARASNHYGGSAVDIVAIDLPRRLSLTDPEGRRTDFDLSGAEQPLDLSLTPNLIAWIERSFGMKKLLGDYPHWDDRRGRPTASRSLRGIPDR